MLHAKGQVVLHLTSLSFRTWPRMLYEHTLNSFLLPSKIGVLLNYDALLPIVISIVHQFSNNVRGHLHAYSIKGHAHLRVSILKDCKEGNL